MKAPRNHPFAPPSQTAQLSQSASFGKPKAVETAFKAGAQAQPWRYGQAVQSEKSPTVWENAGHLYAALGNTPRWCVLGLYGVLLLCLGVALLTYHPADAAWSTSGQTGGYFNRLGAIGAWCADILLYFFGRSAWLAWAGIVFIWIKQVWHCMMANPDLAADDAGYQSTPYIGGLKWAGLIVLVLVSCVLETSRLSQSLVALPYGAGGVFGFYLGKITHSLAPAWVLGFIDLSLIVLWITAIAVFLGFSWLKVAEYIAEFWEDKAARKVAAEDNAENVSAGQAAIAQRQAEMLLEQETQLQQKETQLLQKETLIVPDTVPATEPAYLAKPEILKVQTPVKNEPSLFDEPLSVMPALPLATAVAIPPMFAEKTKSTYDLPAVEPAKVQVIASTAVAQEQKRMAEARARAQQNALFDEPASDSSLPPLGLLDEATAQQEFVSRDTLEFTSRLIEKKLRDFNVTVKVVAAQPGPVITRYEIEPADGIKGSQIVGLARDLARALSLVSLRVVENIPGKTTMGLELPNPKRQIVRLSEIIGSKVYAASHAPLTVVLGKDITGLPVVADLGKMPHVLVAGTTGSGKSVGINAMILSLLYKSTPEQVRLILIDPKMLEMSMYEGIPHLLAPVVTDMKDATNALNWCVMEMERRYKLMSKMAVRNLQGFNNKLNETLAKGEFLFNPFSLTPEDPEPLKIMSHIVVVIDELADLMIITGKKVEEPIARLTQKARACGIHLIVATQRPSVDVITGVIKANIPSRIAFQVSSKIDSRTILDEMGAEALLGMGDMLYSAVGALPVRVHGAFVSDEEVHRVVQHLRQTAPPDYVDGVLDGPQDDDADDSDNAGKSSNDGEQDSQYDNAVAVILREKRATISLVQRELRIGYGRAARILASMEKAGLVSKMDSKGARILLSPEKRNESV